MGRLIACVGNIGGPVIPNTVFDLDAVVTTNLDDTFCGLLIIGVTTDSAVGVWRIENGGGAVVSMNALFSNTKDTAGKYNCYYEGGYLKIQNKVGNAKLLKVSSYGLEPATA